MAIQMPVEKWSGKIEEIAIGATKEEGGTRSRKVVIGGENTLPFLHFDGAITNRPVVALEVLDHVPELPDVIKEELKDVLGKPVEWAKACEHKYGADIICLKLKGADPETANRSVDDEVKLVQEVVAATTLPLLVYGCGNEEKDIQIFQACGELLKKEKCAIGLAENEKYKSIAAVSMAFDQNLVAFSNLDINLAKQLNILLTDFGVKKNRIIMDPLQGGLGYGLDYSYSVIERIRLAALQGDAMLQMPMICDASIAWNAREAHEPRAGLGEPEKRGPMWEATTAMSSVMAGANIVILRSPTAAKKVKHTIEQLMKKGGE